MASLRWDRPPGLSAFFSGLLDYVRILALSGVGTRGAEYEAVGGQEIQDGAQRDADRVGEEVGHMQAVDKRRHEDKVR